MCSLVLDREPPAALPPGGWQVDHDGLEARHRAALDRGVTLDAHDWKRLGLVAQEALVPESEASRERGAGGGDDNA